MKICEDFWFFNGQFFIVFVLGQSEYGFVEKVVEGMFIIVNFIIIKIYFKVFYVFFELWQFQGYSVNFYWQQSDFCFICIIDFC